jgi:hypothetical protein
MSIRYGRVRCNACGDFYDIDESHVCASASIQLADLAADATAIPDPDRAHPASLTWVEPLVPRPIVIGPSADRPEMRPVLAIDAHRFWSEARHGHAVGHAEIQMDTAVLHQGMASNPRQGFLRAAVAEAAAVWVLATENYAREMSA